MTLIELQGGLGNQLYYLTLAKLVSREELIMVDLSWYISNISDTRRTLSVDVNKYFCVENPKICRVLRRVLRTSRFDASVIMTDEWVECYDLLIAEQFKTAERFKSSDWLEKEDIAIHVRIGDYVAPQYRTQYHLTDDEYFENAISAMRQLSPGGRLLVVTDSPPLVSEYYPRLAKAASDIKSISELDDFLFLARHKYLIASNSSYSLLAGLINFPNKCVVLPKAWLTTEKINVQNFPQENFLWI